MNIDDEHAVRAIVAAVAHEIDFKRWGDLRALYAAEVVTDYTSLFGGTVQRVTGDELIAGWRSALARVSTQHLLGPIDVRQHHGGARAECHVRGWHVAPGCPGGDEWCVGGHYVFALTKQSARWVVSEITLQTLHQTGNAKLLAEAASLPA
jgi:hypothetical protein